MEKIDAYHLLNEAIDKFKKEEYDQARNIIDEALTIDPDIPELHYWRGRIESLDLNQEKIKIAISEYTEALDKKPDYVDALIERGKLYLLEKDYEKARQDLEKALELDPNRKDVYQYLGELELALGNKEKALEYLNKTSKEKDEKFYFAMAQALFNVGKYEEALENINKAIELNKNFPKAYELKSDILKAMGRYEEALDAIETAAKLQPTDSKLFDKKALILFKLSEEEYKKQNYLKSVYYLMQGLEINYELKPDFECEKVFEKAIEEFEKNKDYKKIMCCIDYIDLYLEKNKKLKKVKEEAEKKLPFKEKLLKTLKDLYTK